MNRPDFFRDWIKSSKPLIWICLLFLLLSALMPFGLFALNQQYVIAWFGAQPEDISFSMQLTYAGIISILTIQFRFLQYFERRAYMIVVLLAGILISIANLYTRDLHLFMLLRLFQGFQSASMAGCILTLILATVPPPKTMIIGSSVFYGAILGNVAVIGLFFAWVTVDMDWQTIYRYLALYQGGGLLIALLLLKRDSGMKRYPLYQIDWSSFVLCLAFTISLAYTVIYGPKYYWFADARIGLGLLIATGSGMLLFYRQSLRKRPYWHPAVFRIRNFWIGLLLLLLYYAVKDSINLIYAYCFGIVRWETKDVMLLGTVNLAGVVILMIIGARLMLRRIASFKTLALMGFGLLLAYHIWMYLIFTPDLSFADLALPVFLQGAASGLLFVPIVLFMVSSLPPYTGFTGIALATVTRFSATLVSIAGFYSIQLYYNQLNKESFLTHLTAMDNTFSERIGLYGSLFRSKGFYSGAADGLATGTLARSLSVQSQLLTDMQVFRTMSFVIAGVMTLIVLLPLLYEIYNRQRNFIIDRRRAEI